MVKALSAPCFLPLTGLMDIKSVCLAPHLVELGERVQVNGKNTPMHEIEQIVDRIKPVAEAMEKKQPGMHPTFFEIMTMVAFLVFQKEKVDIAVIETGLGGVWIQPM